MKKIHSFLCGLVLVASVPSYAQSASVTPSMHTKEEIPAGRELTLPLSSIMESDIVWSSRVWRECSINDKELSWAEGVQPEKLATHLSHALLTGVFSGEIKAYSADNDRFTTELSRQDVIKLITPDANGAFSFNPGAITGFRIKEDWLYLESEHAIKVRILGIAPVFEAEGTSQPAFWIYYPDAVTYLDKQVIPGGVAGKEQTWFRFLQLHEFPSQIQQVKESRRR